LRRRYLEQRNTLLQGLKKAWGNTGVVSGHNAGMHLAFRLPSQGPDAHHVAAAALRYGIRLYPLAQAASQEADGSDPRHLLFGYANLECSELQQAMQHLALIQARLNHG
jgi:GntR family transcriptional regulator/MocR family aminotransferase